MSAGVGAQGIGASALGATNPYAAGLSAASGLASGGPSSAASGDSTSTSGTGDKVFNFGGNPNVGLLGVGSPTTSPVLLFGLIAVAAFLFSGRRKRR